MEAILSLFLCIFTLIFLGSSVESSSLGFSTNLIHRDSPLSPYYNSSNTYYDNLHNSFRRARGRSSHIFTPNLASSPPTIQAPLTQDTTEYLMKLSIGTPPQDLFVVVDTASNLAWTQCQPCTKCYNSPLYDPQKSSTYTKQPCQSNACQESPQTAFCNNDTCQYQITYGDNSYSYGDISSDSFTFMSTSGTLVTLPNISFGCGHNNGGVFDEYTSGIAGLGNNELTLVKQLDNTGKFSYCLAPPTANVTSKISFGSEAVVSGAGVQTTTLYTLDPLPFYYLNLESVSIGGTNLKYDTKKYSGKATHINDDYDDGNANMIIDSGTTITYLQSDFYHQIENAFINSIHAQHSGYGDFTLCYYKEDVNMSEVPTVTFHFTGADIELDVENTIAEVEEGVICLSMGTLDDDDGNNIGAVFGNWQQRDYLVGYDLQQKTLSFKKVDCSQQ